MPSSHVWFRDELVEDESCTREFFKEELIEKTEKVRDVFPVPFHLISALLQKFPTPHAPRLDSQKKKY